MFEPDNRGAFEILCALAASGGRGDSLFGKEFLKLPERLAAFLSVSSFPEICLEFPLLGKPYTDVTVIYGAVEPGTTLNSEATGDCGALFAWYAEQRRKYPEISIGFEMDSALHYSEAAFGFQPRRVSRLVMPYCRIIGAEKQGELYLKAAERMPGGWPLSYLGVYRGRRDSPLRISGYLQPDAVAACAGNPAAIRSAFDQIGFADYDDPMLEQIAEVLSLSPFGADYQFDLYPDGSFSDMFSLDVFLKEKSSAKIRMNFENGPAAGLAGLLESWGIADSRISLLKDAAVSRGIPVITRDHAVVGFGLVCSPSWIKVRWKKRRLQPSKACCCLRAGRL